MLHVLIAIMIVSMWGSLFLLRFIDNKHHIAMKKIRDEIASHKHLKLCTKGVICYQCRCPVEPNDNGWGLVYQCQCGESFVALMGREDNLEKVIEENRNRKVLN